MGALPRLGTTPGRGPLLGFAEPYMADCGK
jgi:hypothetical protein